MLTIKGISFTRFIPGIIWFFIVLFLISLPKEDVPEPEGWWGWMKKIYVDKWVHTIIFCILAWLFMRPFLRSSLDTKLKWQYVIRISIAVCAWGGATELIQLFVPGRTCDLLDFIADSLGAIIALFISRRIYFRHRPTNPGI